MHRKQYNILMKTTHVMQFSEKNIPLYFEDHLNAAFWKGQGIVTSEAMVCFSPALNVF